MITPPRNTRLLPILLTGLVFLFSALIFFRSSLPSIGPSIAGLTIIGKSKVKPANSTLGFGGIYVVSGPGSPRRYHLEEAAAVTELNLTIPEQIVWSEEDSVKFRTDNLSQSQIGEGSVKAWLSHHLVLKAFLESGQETALIFEDDVDWDVRLRTLQVPRTQVATRQLLKDETRDAEAYPWGRPSDWDLLYIGHCGDYLNPLDQGIGVGHHHPSDMANVPNIVFADDSMSYFTDLHPFTASLLVSLRVPERHRMIHESRFPLCSFGYAVTRDSAQAILNQVAPAKENTRDWIGAYDVALLLGCQSRALRCLSVQPELFHHMDGQSMIGEVDANPFPPPVDLKGLEQVMYRKATSNIDCGFFDGAFYYNGDLNRLAYLREEVGRKGRCLKEPRR